MADSTRGVKALAYITGKKERVIAGGGLMLYEEDEEEREVLSIDIAKALKCDVVQLKNKDYLLVQNR